MRSLLKQPSIASSLLLAVVLLGAPAAAAAADGIIKVYASTFNELADAIEPVQFSGHYKFEVCTYWCVTICDSDWTAEVTQVNFTISPTQVRISGRVDARWCDVDFNAELDTTGNVSYSASQNAIQVTVNPTNIQPRFEVLGYDVPLPVSINVAPALTLPPIPVATAFFYFETARGAETLHLSAHNIFLTKRNGYIELQADVYLH